MYLNKIVQPKQFDKRLTPLTVFRHIKDLRLSLGQISELLRLRKESYCNVKLKWRDTGLHTVCAGESRAL